MGCWYSSQINIVWVLCKGLRPMSLLRIRKLSPNCQFSQSVYYTNRVLDSKSFNQLKLVKFMLSDLIGLSSSCKVASHRPNAILSYFQNSLSVVLNLLDGSTYSDVSSSDERSKHIYNKRKLQILNENTKDDSITKMLKIDVKSSRSNCVYNN